MSVGSGAQYIQGGVSVPLEQESMCKPRVANTAASKDQLVPHSGTSTEEHLHWSCEHHALSQAEGLWPGVRTKLVRMCMSMCLACSSHACGVHDQLSLAELEPLKAAPSDQAFFVFSN